MSIKRINQFPSGSGVLTGDDLFLVMDDPEGSANTVAVSLNNLIEIIGSGSGSSFDQNLNTTDKPSFKGINLTSEDPITITDLVHIGAEEEDFVEGVYFTTQNIGNLSFGWKVSGNGPPVDYTMSYTHNDQSGYLIVLPPSYDPKLGPEVTFEIISIKLNFDNDTSLSTGSFDNDTGGLNGISLNCAIGYELNWQGGHLKSTNDGGVIASPIYFDSNIELPGDGDYNLEINNSGILFTDGSIITTSSDIVKSNIVGITGASGVNNIVSISQANYDNIVTPDPNTLYFIV